MFEDFWKTYKDYAKKAGCFVVEHEKNDKLEIVLLILMVLVILACAVGVVIFRIYIWQIISIGIVVMVVLGTSIELYRRKYKDKKYVEQRRERYQEKYITPLIKTLKELSFSDVKGVEWAIYHCEKYKEHNGNYRFGRFLKNLSVIVVLPAAGFVWGALSSNVQADNLAVIIDLVIYSILLIILIGYFIFFFNDGIYKRYIDLEANLRYIIAQPELMRQLRNNDEPVQGTVPTEEKE